MPTVRQLASTVGIPADRRSNTPTIPRNSRKPLMLLKPRISAIEYIVMTAQPGEVIHVTDEDYRNPHLWRSYLDV